MTCRPPRRPWRVLAIAAVIFAVVFVGRLARMDRLLTRSLHSRRSPSVAPGVAEPRPDPGKIDDIPFPRSFVVHDSTGETMPDHERELLEKTVADLEPKARVEALRQALDRWVRQLPADDAHGRWSLVEWCDRQGLTAEGDRLADEVLKINPSHPAANRRHAPDCVYPGWDPADVERRAKACKDEAERLAKLSPREREVYRKKRELTAEFGPESGGPEIEFLDVRPYLLCLQKSQDYVAHLRLSDFSEITTHFFSAFRRMSAPEIELTDLSEAVLVIFVFQDRPAYLRYGATIGLAPNAGGHYEQGGKKRVVIYNDCPDPYETLFHACTIQLVDLATLAKGKKGSNLFWFIEGLATYFENFKRDPKEGYILGEVSTGKYLPIIKVALRAKMIIPLGKLTELEYAQVLMECARDRTETKIQIYRAEAWALTHFFCKYDHGKYQARFEEYFRREINGQGGPAAFREIFGDPQALQGEWIEYVQSLK